MREITNPVIIELHYLPCLAYFSAIKKAETVFLEACENFQKQTCRNRCYVLGANQIDCLTIPVKHSAEKILIRDVAIDYSQRWQSIHWRTIVAAYRKSPFFAYYVSDFEKVFATQPKFLFDFNEQLLTICLKLLNWSKSIELTDTYSFSPKNTANDLRNLITPEKTTENQAFYKPVAYVQNFGKEFAPNLSILDLLFCEGNFAGTYL
jgi:hypothetical protein